MSDTHRIDRKNFLKLTISCAGTGAAAWLVGCSDGGEPVIPGASGAGGATGGSSGVGGSGGAGQGGGAGSGGGAGASAGMSGTTGGGGASGGKAGAGGSAGASGSAPAGGAGGASGGSAGAAGAGKGGAGSGGVGGAGTSGTGGALGGAGSGGKGGGTGGGSGGGKAASCGTLTIMQTMGEPHDHIPDNDGDAEEYVQSLLDHINGPDALMPFAVASEGFPTVHTHALVFTQAEIDMLRAGGTVTGKTHEEDDLDEVHVWTISCA